MTIQQLGCPHCGGMFQIDDLMAGQQVGCPHCQNAVMVPGPSMPATPQSPDYYGGAGPAPWPSQGGYAPQYPDSVQPSAPMTHPGGAGGASTLSCSLCGGGFQVDPSMAGQQVACPHCGGIVTLPGAPTTAPAAPQGMPAAPTAPAGWPGGQPTPVPGVPHAPQATGPVPTSGTPPSPATTPAAAGQSAPVSAAPTSVPAGPAPATSGPGAKAPVPSSLKPKPQEAPRAATGPAAKPSTAPVPTKPKQPAPTPSPAPTPTSAQNYPPGHKAPTSPATPSNRSAPAESAKAAPKQPAAPRDVPPAKRPDQPVRPTEKKPAAELPAKTTPAADRPPEEKAAKEEVADKTTAPVSTPMPARAPDTAAVNAKIDSLLPPGTAGQPIPASRPLPITTGQGAPSAESDLPADGASATIAIPTQEGGFVQVYEPVKKVEYAGEEVELHRLTPEERARKRFVKNIIMAIIGVAFLIGLGAILMSMR